MNSLYLTTDGSSIKLTRAVVYDHPSVKAIKIAKMQLEIGDMKLFIDFDNINEIQKFCFEHNFPLEDRRPQIPPVKKARKTKSN